MIALTKTSTNLKFSRRRTVNHNGGTTFIRKPSIHLLHLEPKPISSIIRSKKNPILTNQRLFQNLLYIQATLILRFQYHSKNTLRIIGPSKIHFPLIKADCSGLIQPPITELNRLAKNLPIVFY